MLGHVGGMDGSIIVGLTNVCTTETETSGENDMSFCEYIIKRLARLRKGPE